MPQLSPKLIYEIADSDLVVPLERAGGQAKFIFPEPPGSPQREERELRYALHYKVVHKGIIVALSDVEKALYSDDLRDLLRLRELPSLSRAQELVRVYLKAL